jgi:hypothetical protein
MNSKFFTRSYWGGERGGGLVGIRLNWDKKVKALLQNC